MSHQLKAQRINHRRFLLATAFVISGCVGINLAIFLVISWGAYLFVGGIVLLLSGLIIGKDGYADIIATLFNW